MIDLENVMALKKHGQRQTSFFCFSIDNSKSSLIKEEGIIMILGRQQHALRSLVKNAVG